MKLRPLGRTGLSVSEVGLGTMMFGEKTTETEAIRIVHRALNAGVNVIDVADVYAGGESERIVGKALRGRRSEALLATKVGRATPLGEGLSRAYIYRAVEESLSRLDTDYIDLYQIHRWDPNTPVAETLEALTELVTQGRVRFIGCSNLATWQLYKALHTADVHGLQRFETIQPRYNLVFREPEGELLPYCLHEQVGVLAYSPLAGGVLTGKYLEGIPALSRGDQNPGWQANRLTTEAQAAARAIQAAAQQFQRPAGEVAIRWCLAHPAVSCALVGPRTEAQWDAALQATEWDLTSAEAASISALVQFD